LVPISLTNTASVFTLLLVGEIARLPTPNPRAALAAVGAEIVEVARRGLRPMAEKVRLMRKLRTLGKLVE